MCDLSWLTLILAVVSGLTGFIVAVFLIGSNETLNESLYREGHRAGYAKAWRYHTGEDLTTDYELE